MTAERLLGSLLTALDDELPEAVALRRRLHEQPNLSGEEGPTAQVLAEELGGHCPPVADTGFLTRLGPPTGPAVAVRAELDALPMVERSGVTWASTSGAAHACGHDVHMAAAVALARATRSVPLPVGLLLLFQPREETYPSGAKDIVAAGVLREHDVRAVIAAHVHPRVPHGHVSLGTGAVNAASDEFHIMLTGHGGHGAYPHSTVDPVPALAQVVLALHGLVGRRIDPMHPAVLTVGKVLAGASANVVPDRAELLGTVRTTDERDRDTLHEAIRTTTEGIASSWNTKAEVTITRGEPVLVNDTRLVNAAVPLLARCGLPVAADLRSCGSDDFSFLSHEVPGIMAFVGTHTEGVERQPGLHHASFLPPDDAVGGVARVMAVGYAAALDALHISPG